MQRLLDDLIRYVRAVEIASIDVIYTSIDGFSEDCDGFLDVLGWSPNVRTSQLHRSISHSVDC
jgi:hypothetical protein